MKIGIMQPYLFPYIGYFQLIKGVDKFVIYDDVNFIKQGWINRNNILVQGQPLLFTLPLNNQSSFLKINEVLINSKLYNSWKIKFLRTIEQSYKKAPYFNEVYNIIDNVTTVDENSSIADIATRSIIEVGMYLKINTQIIKSSTIYNNSDLKGKERVIDICKKENSNHYINPLGGQELYDKIYFKENNLMLNFIKPLQVNYKQFNDNFVSWLSIIDVLMFNSIEDVDAMLNEYNLI